MGPISNRDPSLTRVSELKVFEASGRKNNITVARKIHIDCG
jgi:hypothetical protein